MTTLKRWQIEVSRRDLRQAERIDSALDVGAAVANGGTVLAIDHYALTANNITYAAFGETMAYWSFFPARDGFGIVPVWGFATVEATATPGLSIGERIFGYFPMGSHLVVQAERLNARRFVDGAVHRKKLPPVYNGYERVAGDPTYRPDREAAQMILRPLVLTSFLIADFLSDERVFGAKQIVVSSASSKTSLGLAVAARRLLGAEIALVGLTSPRNVAFTNGTGAYDRVLTYDQVSGLDASVPTVFVDMAGNADVVRAIHTHVGAALVHSCRVGGTHWETLAGRMELPGARPVFFFAPSRIEKRLVDWGPGGLETRFAALWPDLTAAFETWLRIETCHGPDAALAAFHNVRDGKVGGDVGIVVSAGLSKP